MKNISKISCADMGTDIAEAITHRHIAMYVHAMWRTYEHMFVRVCARVSADESRLRGH